jgi:stearoyl-CoA desaturase (delta-9 desaturase)
MSNLERRITITAVVEPFLAFLVALCLLWGGAVSALDIAILAVMYALTGFGVTIGFHRLLTHRAFTAPNAVRRRPGDPGITGGPRRRHSLGGRPPQAPRLRR